MTNENTGQHMSRTNANNAISERLKRSRQLQRRIAVAGLLLGAGGVAATAVAGEQSYGMAVGAGVTAAATAGGVAERQRAIKSARNTVDQFATDAALASGRDGSPHFITILNASDLSVSKSNDLLAHGHGMNTNNVITTLMPPFLTYTGSLMVSAAAASSETFNGYAQQIAEGGVVAAAIGVGIAFGFDRFSTGEVQDTLDRQMANIEGRFAIDNSNT